MATKRSTQGRPEPGQRIAQFVERVVDGDGRHVRRFTDPAMLTAEEALAKIKARQAEFVHSGFDSASGTWFAWSPSRPGCSPSQVHVFQVKTL